MLSKSPLAALRAAPRSFRLNRVDPSSTPGFTGPKERSQYRATEELADDVKAIGNLQQKLYAEGKRSLLVILQGMDTSGKDGVMRGVFTGLNPQGVTCQSFKKPSENELRHDFLWRIHNACPARGMIGVFNRSHYEDVLIVRVHELVPRSVWATRYKQINDFEAMLAENGTTVVKCMLHISNAEQLERLNERLRTPESQWKFSMVDVEERKLWPEYQAAYEDAIRNCSTKVAPWYVIPADRKWYRNWAIAKIVRAKLEQMDPEIPKPTIDPRKVRIV